MLKLTRKVLSLVLIASIALSMAVIVSPDTKISAASKTPDNGWYNLRAMNNYLNIDASGGAELRDNSTSGNQALYVENKGNGQITLKMPDGRYLGIADTISNGVRVKAVNSPYLWYVFSENNNDIYSLRPHTNLKMVLNASGQKNVDGTHIVLWTYEDMDAPNHAEFRFISASAIPSKSTFVVNDKPMSVTAAYSINNTNYLQLRAIAAMLNGTEAQFDIGWDGQYAVIIPGKPYSGSVTETKLQTTMNIRKSTTKFKLNDEIFSFDDAKLIDGDTNYIQLREFAQKLSGTASQFDVYWDGDAGKVVIQPGVAYTGYAPGTGPKSPSADKIDMALIPAGTYITGGRYVNREITISQSFYMGIYPVTQEQFQAVMGYNPSLFQGTGKVSSTDANGVTTIYNRTPAAGENPNKRPVDRVNWYEAIAFCNKLSIKEGLTPAYSIEGVTDPDKWGKIPTEKFGSSEVWDSAEIVQGSTGYRLPTEAQWEYACRAGTTTAYNTGKMMTNDTGWYSGNGNSQTHEVGKKTPNAFGLYDMHGNVWEWCWDWYCGDLPTYAQTDPIGPKGPWITTGRTRVQRGGSFAESGDACASDVHWHLWPEDNRQPDRGFRVVRPDPASMVHTDKPVVQGMQWIPDGTLGKNKVEGFYMGTYEVTQDQYYKVMRLNPSEFKNGIHITKGEYYGSRPVDNVSWYNAIKFCNLLSIQEGLSPAYSIKGSTDPSKWGVVPTKKDENWEAVEIVPGSNGYRLPTELQWEYACRAGTTTKYNSGRDVISLDKQDGLYSTKAGNIAWYADSSKHADGVQKTHEVGLLAPNAFGLYDMHGNVGEWCWSNPTEKGYRIYRGGSFISPADQVTSSVRFSAEPSSGKRYIGFRIVLPYSDALKNKSDGPFVAAKDPTKMLKDGWYALKIVNKNVSFNSSGVLIVDNKDDSQIFYIENLGNNRITIKTKDGKYVGISDDIKAGTHVKKVNSPYKWYITFDSGGIRPATNTDYVAVVAEGNHYSANGSSWDDGSRIALTKRVLPDAENPEFANAKFQFYTTPAPKK